MAAGPFLLAQSVDFYNPTNSFFTIAILVVLGIVHGMRQSESPESPKVDPLLCEVKNAIEAVGVSRSMFGYQVAGDPTLILKMERGRHIKKPALRKAIEVEIAALKSRAAAAAALD